MQSIKRKLSLKKKITSNINELIKQIVLLDETSISFSGDFYDSYSKKINESFYESLSLQSKINCWLKNLDGLSGKKYRYLLNNLVSKFSEPKYLEIGSWTGSTACAASFKNDLSITCIDNWSQFLDKTDEPKKQFLFNINKCLTKKTNFEIIDSNFRNINFNKIGKFNIYFYDASHHYEDHYDAITLVQESLEDKYILIVDDWNWDQVRKGTFDAIKKLNLKNIFQLEIKTTHDSSSAIINGKISEWHNGYSFFVLKK